MTNSLSHVSKSIYIQSLVQSSLEEVFSNQTLLRAMTQELTQELKTLDLEKGYLNQKEEKRLQLSTGEFLGAVTRKIINLTYEKFMSTHQPNIVRLKLKKKFTSLGDIFLFNIKGATEHFQDQGHERLYREIKDLTHRKMEVKQLLNLEEIPEFVTSDIEMILLDDQKTVCYCSKRAQTNDHIGQQYFKEVLSDSEVNLKLTQFLSYNTPEEEKKEIMTLHRGFIQSAFESSYADSELYGEQALERIKKLMRLGYITYETPEGKSCEYDVLEKLLLKNQFNPAQQIKELYE